MPESDKQLPIRYHSWIVICKCCGIQRRVKYRNGGITVYEYLVDGEWTTARPQCETDELPFG